MLVLVIWNFSNMDINDLKKIGARLKAEMVSNLNELRKGPDLGKGASGDTTHCVDKKAEDIVFEEAEKLNIPLTIVSEEYGRLDLNGGGPKLLTDPIDGSRNAFTGIPLFSTSMALIDGDVIGQTRLGYVINLISGDEFWTVKGKGAFLNGKTIQTQKEYSFKVIASEVQSPARDIPGILPLISLYNRSRCFGSTALDLAFLAQGAVSTFIVPVPSRSFDFAAGYLLIKEAGGIITDTEGHEIDHIEAGINRSTPLLASGNKMLHKKALEILKTS